MALEYRKAGGKLSRNRQRAAQQPHELRRQHNNQPPFIIRDPWRERFPKQFKAQGDQQPDGGQVKEDV